MKNEPIKHHYIPQFILRNFCYDDDYLWYYNLGNHVLSSERTYDVFMERNLYRDNINHPAEPTKIEKDFSKYEREIAILFQNKFIGKEDIELSIEEAEKIKLFFALVGLRSKNAYEQFTGPHDNAWINIYGPFQPDGDWADCWRRNLGLIVNCRSNLEVQNRKDIDPPFKIFILRDTEGYMGSYFKVAKASENEDFLIGDSYPSVRFCHAKGNEYMTYSSYPISSDMIIFQVYIGVSHLKNVHFPMRPGFFKPPHKNQDGNFCIHVKPMTDEEARFTNQQVAYSSRSELAFANPDRVTINPTPYFPEQ